MGLYYTTKRKADRGKFRTPSLRELKYTAPYMHNGAFFELDEVIDFYDEGGGQDSNKSPLLKKLGLSDEEKEICWPSWSRSRAISLCSSSPLNCRRTRPCRKEESMTQEAKENRPCMSRRAFLLTGGVVGPDLTFAGERRKDPKWHVEHFKFPQKVSSGSAMPAYAHLSPPDL